MPNWVSWAAHSHWPLPSFRTYTVLSLSLFLGAVFNCSLFSSFSDSLSEHSQVLLNSYQLVDSWFKSWFNWMIPSAISVDVSIKPDQNENHELYSSIFNYFNLGHVDDQSPESLLSELSKLYAGGFPKEIKQIPFYCAFLLQNSLVVWVSLVTIFFFCFLL